MSNFYDYMSIDGSESPSSVSNSSVNSEIETFFGFIRKGSDPTIDPKNELAVTHYILDSINTPEFYRNAETKDEYTIASSGTPEKTGNISMQINKTAFFSPIKLENEGRSTGSYSGELMGFKVKEGIEIKLIALDQDQPVLFLALRNKILGRDYLKEIENEGYLSKDEIALVKNDENLKKIEVTTLITEHFPYNEDGEIIEPIKNNDKWKGVRNSVGLNDRIINAILMIEYDGFFDGYGIKQLPTQDGGSFHSEFTLNDFAREKEGTVEWLKIEQSYTGNIVPPPLELQTSKMSKVSSFSTLTSDNSPKTKPKNLFNSPDNRDSDMSFDSPLIKKKYEISRSLFPGDDNEDFSRPTIGKRNRNDDKKGGKKGRKTRKKIKRKKSLKNKRKTNKRKPKRKSLKNKRTR